MTTKEALKKTGTMLYNHRGEIIIGTAVTAILLHSIGYVIRAVKL